MYHNIYLCDPELRRLTSTKCYKIDHIQHAAPNVGTTLLQNRATTGARGTRSRPGAHVGRRTRSHCAGGSVPNLSRPCSPKLLHPSPPQATTSTHSCPTCCHGSRQHVRMASWATSHTDLFLTPVSRKKRHALSHRARRAHPRKNSRRPASLSSSAPLCKLSFSSVLHRLVPLVQAGGYKDE